MRLCNGEFLGTTLTWRALRLCTCLGKWAGCKEVTQPWLLFEGSAEAGVSLKWYPEATNNYSHRRPSCKGIPGVGLQSVVPPAAEEMGPSELTLVQSDLHSANLILIKQRQSYNVGLY